GMDAKELAALLDGKNEEQKKVVKYFVSDGGCLEKTLTDEEYDAIVRGKRDNANFKKKALSKIGLDEDQVKEIPPAMFEGFVMKDAFAKKRANGKWVSSAYQVSWVFFSTNQIYLYSCVFNMDEDKKSERTDEFFYKDVTSFSTTSETQTPKVIGDKKVEVNTNRFAMVVPGDKLFMAMDGVRDSESIIQAMKQKLREKKMG
ncbi:MAG: hypothetical protein WCL06_13225, partial [Bacteroidota bacterium]